MITLALVVEAVADILVVSPGMGPGTMPIIKEEIPDSRVFVGMLKITADATKAGNVVVEVVGTHGKSSGRIRRKVGRKRKVAWWDKKTSALTEERFNNR